MAQDERPADPVSPREREDAPSATPFVVAIGVSSVGNQATESFLSNMADARDLALVIVLQDLEQPKEHEDPTTLAKMQNPSLTEVVDGTSLEAGRIYLCPARMTTTVAKGRLTVTPLLQAHGERGAIDGLMISLAEDRAEEAIGIVFHGTESDGILGLSAIKDRGGLAIAQDVAQALAREPAENRDNGEPAALILSVDEITRQVSAYIQRLKTLKSPASFDSSEPKGADGTGMRQASEERQNEPLIQALESTTEALSKANRELAQRVEELTRVASHRKEMLESARVAILRLSNDLRIIDFTPAATQLLQLAQTDIGHSIQSIKATFPIDEFYEDIRKVLRTRSNAEREITAADGSARYMMRILPCRGAENRAAGVVVSFVDITGITAAEERQRAFLAELQHRVRNALAVMRSIVRRSATSGISIDDYIMHLDGRLNAFARTQALVTRDPQTGVDLEYLVAEELLAFKVQDGERLTFSGPTIRFRPKAAETFGLAVHELTTNAVKFGALSACNGRIEVRWRLIGETDAPYLTFEWRETGGPPITAQPSRQGFGTELLERTLAYELKAKTFLDYAPEGLRCRIEMPLAGHVVEPR